MGTLCECPTNNYFDDFVANGVVEEAIIKATQRIKSSLLHQCEDPTDGLDIT